MFVSNCPPAVLALVVLLFMLLVYLAITAVTARRRSDYTGGGSGTDMLKKAAKGLASVATTLAPLLIL